MVLSVVVCGILLFCCFLTLYDTVNNVYNVDCDKYGGNTCETSLNGSELCFLDVSSTLL